MRTSDIFGFSFNAIRLRKLKAALTTLGVVIGIAAIVALLSITQGLQTSLTSQLNDGLSADTLVLTAGGGALGGISGPPSPNQGFGGGASTSSGDSGFALYLNDTEIISSLSTDIETVTPVISRSGYIVSENLNGSVTLYGVDFETYPEVYSSTFVAKDGSIPNNPDNNEVVIGAHVNDPGDNGTIYFNTGDHINVSWTNSTTYPLTNET